MKKLEKIRTVKQYKQYEYTDRIRQNGELHMNAYNPYIKKIKQGNSYN